MRPFWHQLLESLPSVRTLVLPAVQSLSQAAGNGRTSAVSDTLRALSASQNASLPPAGFRWQGAGEARAPSTPFRGFSSKSEAATPISGSSVATSSTPTDPAAAEFGRSASGEPLQVPAEPSTSASEMQGTNVVTRDHRSTHARRVFSMGVYGEFGNRILQEHPVADGAELQWSSFLQEVVGLSAREACNTLATYPHLLSCLPGASATETVEFLRTEAAFSPRNLHATVLRNPWVLGPGVAGELSGLKVFLSTEVGMSEVKCTQLMRQSPMVLQRGTTAMATHSFHWLRSELGLSRRDAQAVLSTTPRLLTCRVSEAGWKLLDLFSGQLGLEKAQVRPIIMRAPRVLLPRGEETAAEALSYLMKDLRLPREPLLRVVMTKPGVLAHAPGDYLAKVVNYLEAEVNFTREEIQKLLVKSPAFLDMNIPSKNRSALSFLQGTLGLTLSDVRRMVAVYPALLRYPGTPLQTTTDWLTRTLGCDSQTVARIVLKSPQVFGHSLDMKMRKVVDFLHDEMGCTPAEALRLIVAQPHIFSYSMEKNLLPKVQYFRSLGMSGPGIAQLFADCPQIVGASLKTLQDKVEYLQKDWDLEGHSTLQEFPLYLSYSLERRIKPRHQYAARVAADGVIRIGPEALLKPSDSQFAIRVGGTPNDFRQHLINAVR